MLHVVARWSAVGPPSLCCCMAASLLPGPACCNILQVLTCVLAAPRVSSIWASWPQLAPATGVAFTCSSLQLALPKRGGELYWLGASPTALAANGMQNSCVYFCSMRIEAARVHPVSKRAATTEHWTIMRKKTKSLLTY